MEEKKKTNSRKVKITVIAICAVLLLVMGATYAWLRLTLNGSKVNVLRAGGLELALNETSEGITLEDVVPVTDAKGLQGKEYTFTLENKGSDSSYTIYLDDVLDIDQNGENDFEESERMSDSDIKYSLIKNGKTTTKVLTETGTNPNRVLDSGIIKKGTTNTYSLRLWIKEEAENDSIMNKIFAAKLRVEAEQKTEETNNIKVAYTYNPTSCITGEESTCVQTSCYESKTSGSCPAGTIIKYAVNDSTTKYFHVLHDDGDTMTLQQRENTVYNTAWYSSEDNSKGPLTILPVLESATSGWTNVNNQTYTMGTTNFNNTNAYTGCTESGCTTNKYTLGQRTGKARMITMQEAAAIGCTANRSKSCPNFMNNYLYDSTSYGGTVNDTHTENGADHNYGYWTMSAYSSNSSYAWHVHYSGTVYDHYTTHLGNGARAVVVVNK